MASFTKLAGLAIVMAAALPSAWGNPSGPSVQQGSAAVAAAGPTLTITSTPGTVIEWQRFVVAPGETTRFIQPAGAAVVNRVPTGFSVLGNLESPGQVYFLTGTLLSGRGLSVDLAGLINSSLRFDALPSAAREGTDGDIRAGQALSNGKVFIIGPGERPGFSRSPAGAVMLAPGMRAELGDLRVPFVRVHVVAPPASALNVDALVARRPQIGMFNALFPPADTRRGETGATAVAAAPSVVIEAPAPVVLASVEERVVADLPLPPAPVEDRSFALAAAPVEDRVARIIVNDAPVEDRSFALAAAPVEDRIARMVVNDAPVEDRTVIVAALEAKFVPVLASVEERPAAYVKEHVAAPVRVAVVVEAEPAPAPRAEKPAEPPVRLAAVHKRMPRIMFDHKGAVFFM